MSRFTLWLIEAGAMQARSLSSRSGCGPLLSTAMLDTEWARLELTRRSAFTHAPGRAVQSVIEHDALLDLLQQRADPETIELAARRHKLNTLEAVARHDEAVSVA